MGQPQYRTTLWDFISAVQDSARSDDEAVAVLARWIADGRLVGSRRAAQRLEDALHS